MANYRYKYGFVLGHVPELSRAEIISFLNNHQLIWQDVFYNSKVFIIAAAKLINVRAWQEELGGTIKIFEVLDLVKEKKLPGTLDNLIKKRIKHLGVGEEKFQFGFSLYGSLSSGNFKRVGLQIKRQLKSAGFKARFIDSKNPDLSSVIVTKEKLLDQGADLVIVKDTDYYIGITVSVQDFAEFSKRDYGRPTRDDRSGMLPPKLARMMVNLSQTNKEQIILDPFCGSGTVIQEALFLRYRKLIGSDISQRAVEFTENNVSWLETKYQLDISEVKIYQLDATDLLDVIPAGSVDAIVTEPYLGPQDKITDKSQVQKVIDELSSLYLGAFRNFHQVLGDQGRVVMVLPVINGQQLDILSDIKEIGFEISPISNDPRGSIVYARQGQRVMREIFIFEKK